MLSLQQPFMGPEAAGPWRVNVAGFLLLRSWKVPMEDRLVGIGSESTAFTGLGSHARRRGQPGNIASYPTVRTAATLPMYP